MTSAHGIIEIDSAIVAGEDDQRVIGKAELLEAVEHLTDVRVQLLDHIAVSPRFAGFLELCGGFIGHMRRDVGEVKKEGLRGIDFLTPDPL